jgi:hypothetical protein
MSFLSSMSQDNSHIRLKLAVRIEGAPFVFVEEVITGATFGDPSNTYTQLAVIDLDGVSEGETSIDLEKRAEKAATLDVTLIDDDARTLRGLFAHNARRATTANGTYTTIDAFITVASGAAFSSGGVFYVGSETVKIGTRSGNNFSGCTRGAFGSTAIAFSTGDSIYSTMPSWQGRRAYLYGYIATAAGVEEEFLLSTWLVDVSPEPTGDLEWRLRLSGVARDVYDRPLYVGIKTVKVGNTIDVTVSGGVAVRQFSTETNGTASLWLGTTFLPVYVIMTGQVYDSTLDEYYDGAGIYRLYDVDTLNDYFTVGALPEFDSRLVIIPQTVRMLCALGGSTSSLIPYLLMSSVGTGTGFDQLPGHASTSFDEVPWRLGAALTANEVDTASFALVQPSPFFLAIDKEMTVEDLLSEYCLRTSTFTRFNRSGQLTILPMAVRPTTVTSLTADIIDPETTPSVEHDESALTPLLTVKTTYDPLDGEFKAIFNFADADLLKRYPRNPRRREIELRMSAIDVASAVAANGRALTAWRNPVTVDPGEFADNIAREVQRGDGGVGRVFVNLAVNFGGLSIELGDAVSLPATLPNAFSGLPDFEGGTLAGRTFRVVGRRPDWRRGIVRLRLQLIDAALVVVPGAVIASVAGAVVTLATTGPEATAAPELDFWVGAGVKIYDISGMAAGSPTVRSYHGITAIQSAPPRLTLSGAFAFVVQNGVDYLVLDPYGSADGVSSTGYSLIDMATMVGPSGEAASPSPPTPSKPRWR